MVQRKLKAANKDKTNETKLVLYVYYSGHGVMDTTSKIVVNEKHDEDRYFPIESKLSIYSAYKNVYIILILDCCREVVPPMEEEKEGD